ncbi:MAG: ABC transporter ATP-binding protein [Candidatus Eremiobacteraeota bacterium]|nr:ABC transporter ATP-binding protein [Candidatus Eremiobacteraeota bacterium]
MTSASAVSFSHIVKEYQSGKRVVDDVSFDVARGQFVVLLGPSGCGKTTLLKTVNRLIEPTSGTVMINDTDARSLEATALRRGIGYVIQQIGLFPHMTVAENVAVVPSLAGWTKQRIQARVEQMLDLVRLPAGQFGGRFPAALSGGQQQRVGLARALAADPELLLMDEPFGALDAIERSRLQGEMIALHQQLRKTVLFVTHDVDEALRLADAIVVMRTGRVVQYGRPLDILARPSDPFVSELVDAGDLVRLFSLMQVRQVELAAAVPADDVGMSLPAIDPDSDLRSALSAMLRAGSLRARVVDSAGAHFGILTLENMLSAAHHAAAGANS